MGRFRRDKGTGGVTKRKDGRWQAVWTFRDDRDCVKRKFFYGRTKKDATDKMRDWVADGSPITDDKRTVTILLAHVLDVILPARDLDSETIDDYRNFATKHINPRIGTIRLGNLRIVDLDRVPLEMIQEGKSAKTARNCQTFLKMAIKEGKRLDWVPSKVDPDLCIRIGTKRYKASLYNLEQVLAFIEAAKGERVQPAIVLAGLCGLREAETAGLLWTDFDLSAGALTISRQNRASGEIKDKTKTESGMRTIALPPFVVKYLSGLPRTSPFLMTTRDGRKPINPSSIYHESVEIMERVSLPKIRFHDLRHSANNILKQLGVPVETRRDILGHSDTSVTENTYTQTVDWEMKDAMGKLDKALRKRG